MSGWTLVTGASSGIGAALARIAAREGQRLILTARREEALERLAGAIRDAHGAEIAVVPADLGQPDGPDRLWSQATAGGREVDFLVNNAGLGRWGRFAEDGWEQEQASIMVNVAATTRLAKLAVAPMAAAGRGRILQIASVAGVLPGPGMAVYNATKAYVVSFSESLAEEMRGSGVSVTCVCPGITETEFQETAGMTHLKAIERAPKQSAGDVAEHAFRAAMAGRRFAVPGAANKALVLAARSAPRGVLARLIALSMR
ncbi:MAG TPA: SDR family oxidoreductase [Thermohalobaculum sp.]|nr:SDR family oxidoreductase [Thermohalobaculum sp.]